MEKTYHFSLEPYKGRATRHTCPNCGRKHCFAYYVDANGRPLSEITGRCDHESKCGYHYKPSDFFRDHLDCKVDVSNVQPIQQPKRKDWFIPRGLVDTYRSNQSNLCKYLNDLYDETDVNDTFPSIGYVYNLYQLGALINGETIFWQIDINGKVRTGKVMQYGPDGHRIKGDQDRITWMHTLLKRDKVIPEDFEIQQCFFGEHLLNIRPEADVMIVESEKTAVVMANLFDDPIWLASGGKNGLNGEKMAVLKGRKIFLYPDADAVSEWEEKVARFRELGYDCTVFDYAYRYTNEDVINHIDPADIELHKWKEYLYGIEREREEFFKNQQR